MIGSKEFRGYVADQVKTWIEEIRVLAEIALTQPHAVYSAFVHGVMNRWSFGSRIISDVRHLLQTLEDAIHQLLVPALTDRPPCSKTERDILALPSRLGSLGILNPFANSQNYFLASTTLTRPLVDQTIAQNPFGNVALDDVLEAKKNIRISNRLRDICYANEIDKVLSKDQKILIALAKEKGSSTWLTVMPVEEHDFFLNKGEFRDALHLCYGWNIRNTPQSCVCGSPFSVDHAMICKRGGFSILNHNEIRDLTANLLTEVCHNVAIEPPLQPLIGEILCHRSANVGDEARLDIKAHSFWNPIQDAFFYVSIFHPNAPCYRSKETAAIYRQHDSAKKREYNQRIQDVENGVFTPLVFSTSGGMGREGSTFYKRLADLLSQKQEK